ncbi:hypothetical protein RO3G_00642 [Rhizopus delemar RA 99-880]|uniref:3-oxo-5-alpha-steroid 4-dehydrogenase C-terminal domain-containing protein n=1 Tax=Rhizopus delemar (strain RA 99-880 / ATCC MYA-4621 / FGSC 9543 / NRRL 43880) TaxID=246409 RepID=I1BIA8_RHIO9|nr:hypothetical protein RO3G_00642 [Rhizopus delemar RA 99-880]|eukprot:EIE75938.1 hypothetical protein RO3G_00642 [Rhizopus delemar RA 99-880]
METLFVHRYSGYCKLYDCCFISCGYTGYTIILNIFTKQVPSLFISLPLIKLGIMLFIFGESVNFYHHLILKDLRNDGSKEYKVPDKGLFFYIWCPHYGWQ